MRRLLLIGLILLILFSSAAVSAQTATRTPSPTPSGTPTPMPTFTPYPFDDMVGTLGIPSAIPALSLTPKPWDTPTPPPPGAAYTVPHLQLGTPDPSETVMPGFQAISESNSLRLGIYVAEVAVGFYEWLNVNFNSIVRALRILSLIVFLMAALYAIILRVAPDLASRANNWRNRPPGNKP